MLDIAGCAFLLPAVPFGNCRHLPLPRRIGLFRLFRLFLLYLSVGWCGVMDRQHQGRSRQPRGNEKPGVNSGAILERTRERLRCGCAG